MSQFGDAVKSLLETYTKCLGLLKGSRSQGKSDEFQNKLGKSLRSDRAKIRHVYSSELSKSGASLDKGDGKSHLQLTLTTRPPV